jgi:hypothetical protein
VDVEGKKDEIAIPNSNKKVSNFLPENQKPNETALHKNNK